MDALKLIAARAAQAPVVLFMKGTPQRPHSAGSKRAVEILDDCQADYAYVDLHSDPLVRAFLPKYSESADCPQLFIGGEFIGGITVIDELNQQGELQKMVSSFESPMAAAN